MIEQTCLAGNMKISDNIGNDYHPRMTTNAHDQTIVVYEQEVDLFSKQVPVVFSADEGQTWTVAYLFDSIDFTSGSGVLQYPDIVYNTPNDLLFLAMIDPQAEMYNNEVSFIPGDIASGGDASWYGISFKVGEGYTYCCRYVYEQLLLITNSENDVRAYPEIFGLFWCTSPDFEDPEGMKVVSYGDGQSVHFNQLLFRNLK